MNDMAAPYAFAACRAGREVVAGWLPRRAPRLPVLAAAEPARTASVSTGCLVTVPGGQPQLDRSTISVGSTSTVGDRRGLVIRSSRRAQARSPSLRIG